ncbi:MAG: hypothetical protein ACLP1W_03720 [Rhodomicrobium sp.]
MTSHPLPKTEAIRKSRAPRIDVCSRVLHVKQRDRRLLGETVNALAKQKMTVEEFLAWADGREGHIVSQGELNLDPPGFTVEAGELFPEAHA